MEELLSSHAAIGLAAIVVAAALMCVGYLVGRVEEASHESAIVEDEDVARELEMLRTRMYLARKSNESAVAQIRQLHEQAHKQWRKHESLIKRVAALESQLRENGIEPETEGESDGRA